MKKKIVLVFTVLLTSAAAVSLILATSRYVGFIKHPESWRHGLPYRVEPSEKNVSGLIVRVAPVGGETEKVSALLVSTFWLFEVEVVNQAERSVDVDFDQVTLRVEGREIRSLTTDAVLRLFNERMTGSFGTAAGRRGQREVLEQLQKQKLGVDRVFPGYTRTSLVFFQPHPEVPEQAVLTLRGIRWAGSDLLPPLAFHVYRVQPDGAAREDAVSGNGGAGVDWELE